MSKVAESGEPARARSTVSSPFCLRERLRVYDSRIGIVPLASVLLVAFLLFSTTSKYIYAPGMTVDLHQDDAPVTTETQFPSAGTELPVFAGRLEGKSVAALLTVRNNNMFIFDGRIYKDLTDALPPVSPEQAGTRGILLVKADKSNNIQALFDLMKIARDAGFSSVQLAGESTRNRSNK